MTATQETPDPEQTLSDALAAAQKTLGASLPRLITRKPHVAMNAAKHQLTSQALFMPPSELADYLSIGAQMVRELEPVGIIEHQFAQRIIDATWRLNRGIALETLAFNSRVAAASSAFIEAHPGESDATILANSQAQAFDKECVDIFDKLSRYGARIEKSLNFNLEQLRVRRESRIGKRGHQYDEKTCAAYAWYSELADLAYALVKAREEIQAKSVPETAPLTSRDRQGDGTPPEPPAVPATATEQSQLPKSLFRQMPCQKPIELVAPLTPETEKTIRLAAQHGLLIGSEHTLFTQPAAA
jgi:hypothetical protein